MSNPDAEQLIEACAAGYVPEAHPDVAVAISVLGKEKVTSILQTGNSRSDAMLKRLPGCCGAKSRH